MNGLAPPRTPRPRLSVRGMMALVALAALGFAVYDSRKNSGRRAYYLDRARVYESRAREFAARADEARTRASEFLRLADQLEGDPAQKQRGWADDQLLRASLYRRVADFDARQERRFRAAAERPWEPPPVETMDLPETIP